MAGTIAVDAAGSAYVVGDTWSNNFPTMNPYQPCGAVSDAFVTKLSPDGAVLQYSTCLSGSYLDSARAIEVDASGFAYVAGWTESTNFPTQGAYQTTKGAGRDAFVAKLSPGGNTLVYSTYLGGGAADQANGLAIDETLKACLVGYTGSFDFPTLNAFQATRHPMEDAFVTCLTPAGDGLVYSTYLGGNNTDIGVAIAMDSAGSAFVAGLTISPDFPLSSPYQNVYRVFDAFVAKLSPTGTSLLYSTYLGGTDYDTANGIAVDETGAAYVAGQTASSDFPAHLPIQAYRGGRDELRCQTLAQWYGTHVLHLARRIRHGEPSAELPSGRGTPPMSGGATASADFPILNGYQEVAPGAGDGFVLKLDDRADISLAEADSADPIFVGHTLTYTLTVSNAGPAVAADVTVTDTLPASLTFVSASSGCSAVGQTVTCTAASLDPGSDVTFTITVIPGVGAIPSVTNTATVSCDQPDPDTSNNTASETTTVNPAADLSVSIADSADPIALGSSFDYTVTVANAGPSTATSVTLTDTLDASVTFVSASAGCSHAAGVVTCSLGDIAASGNTSVTITVTTTADGTITDTASVSASSPADPDSDNNSATETTLVYETEAGNELPFLTATSRVGENLLEWLNPPAPYASTIVRFTTASTFAACAPPASPEDGTLLVVQSGTAGAHDSFTHTGLLSDTNYCYAAFVHKGSGLVSEAKTVAARPVPAGGAVVWGYSTGATATAPVAIGYGANAVSNDNVLHAMVRSDSGGNWPTGWTPFAMTGPAQHRPTSVAMVYGAATRQIFLNSQDGRMYSVDAATGAPLWQTSSFGMLQAGVGGWLQDFGGDEDRLFVGTRLTGADNTLYAVDPATQATAWSFGPPTNLIGPIDAQVAVDYSLGYAYFTSEERSPGADTVWCVDLTTHAKVWSRALGSITSALAYRNGRVYVGSDQGVSSPGTLYALDATNGGATLWSFSTGTGAPNDYLLADRLTDDIYFSTSSTVFSLSDNGSSYSSNWSTTAIADPSAPLYATGQGLLYVGSSDGRLWQIDTTLMATDPPSALKSIVLGDGLAGVGPPTRDNATSLIYLGTVAGVIYAVQQPLP